VSTREEARQAFRTWIKTWADPGTTLTDAQVVLASRGVLRQQLPYCSVRSVSHGLPISLDETVHSLDESDDPQYVTQGERRGVMEVQVYGESAEAWLENLVLSLADIEMHRVIGNLNFTIGEPLGPARELTPMRNADDEVRYVMEFPYTYRVVSSQIPATPLEQVDVDGEFYTDEPGSDTVLLDFTVDLT